MSQPECNCGHEETSHLRIRNSARTCRRGCPCAGYDPRITCAGCGAVTYTAEWCAAREGSALQRFCKTCRTTKDYAFLAKPSTLQSRRKTT